MQRLLIGFIFGSLIATAVGSSFFLTNAEKELLFVGGFSNKLSLPNVERLCRSLGSQTLQNADDATPLKDLLEANMPGVWLNRLDPRECSTKCCGNYLFKQRTFFSGTFFTTEQKPCETLGYALCRVDTPVQQVVQRLQWLQGHGSRVDAWLAEARDSEPEVARLQSETRAAVQATELLLLRLDQRLQRPKLDARDADARVRATLSRDTDTRDAVGFALETAAADARVAVRVRRSEMAAAPLEQLSRAQDDGRRALAARSDVVDQRLFGLRLAFASVDERATQAEADTRNIVDDAQRSLTDWPRDQLPRLHSVRDECRGKSERLQQQATAAIQPLATATDVVRSRASEAGQLVDSWTRVVEAQAVEAEQLQRAFEAVAAALDPTSRNATLVHAQATHRLAIATFQTTSYVLVALALLLVVGNSVLFVKCRPSSETPFQRMTDADL